MKQSLCVLLTVAALSLSVAAQKNAPKAPDYKIEMIQVNAFEESDGKLTDAVEDEKPRSFFNDLSTSLFTWIVVSGEKGSFEAGRKVTVTVTQGKKVILTRTAQIGIPGEDGLYFVPVYIYGPLCSNVKISAKLLGQKTPSALNLTIPFQCGE